MVTLKSVLINAVWILGLAGLLATVSYMDWWRAVQGWSWGRAFNSPRMQAPLCLSLALTALGIGGAGAIGIPPNQWWTTLIWLALAILFLVQCILYSRSGYQHGWDSSLDAAHQTNPPTGENLTTDDTINGS